MSAVHEEDKWFVTDVPGAPLQVVGVREPTGKLSPVYGVRTQGACALDRLKLEAETGAVEVISGPEAERVIEDYIAPLRCAPSRPSMDDDDV